MALPQKQGRSLSQPASDTPSQAVPLLRRSGSQWELSPEGQSLLSSHAQLRLISVCGPAASGKSTLLSTLTETWLEVGEAGESRTQGVWLVRLSQDTFLLDTEALRPESEQLAALLLLMSSLLVYNSVGTIDRTTMAQLQVFCKARRLLGGGELLSFCAQFRPHAPDFLWLLRDFSAPLQLSARDYLEDILRLDMTAAVAESRDLLLNLFPHRDCLTLPRPQDVAQSAFLSEAEAVRKACLSARYREFDGSPLSGSLLLTMLSNAVHAFSRGQSFPLADIRRVLKDEQAAQLLAALKSNYLAHMDLQLRKMPYNDADLAAHLHAIRRESQTTALQTVPAHGNWEHTLDDFEHFVLENERFLREANETAAEAFNQRLAARCFGGLGKDAGDREWREAARLFEEQAVGSSRLRALLAFLASKPIAGMERLTQLVATLQAELQRERKKGQRTLQQIAKLEAEKAEPSADLDWLLEELSTRLQIQRFPDMPHSVFLENVLIELANAQQEAAAPSVPLAPEPPKPPEPQKPVVQPRPAPPRVQSTACCVLL